MLKHHTNPSPLLSPVLNLQVRQNMDGLLGAESAPKKASLAFVDPPFGFQLHTGRDENHNVASCDKAWDEKAWTGEELVQALKNSEAAGFLSEHHTAIIYLHGDSMGEFKSALKGAGYNNIQDMVLLKEEGSRLAAANFRKYVRWISFDFTCHIVI